MTNNLYVELLYKKENELKKICYYHNLNKYDTLDIIQDLYIKLLILKDIDRYVLNGEPNMYIIFMILKNLIFDYRKKEKKFIDEEVIDYLELAEIMDENEKYDFVMNEIENISYWFDRNIVLLYVNYNHTVRSLAKETKISQSTIQQAVYRFKVQCKNTYYIKIKNQQF